MVTIFERERVAFVAALIRGDITKADTLLMDVGERVRSHPGLSEADQKSINQMLAAARKIDAAAQPPAVANLKKSRRNLKAALSRVARDQVRNVAHIGYDDWRQSLALDDDPYRVMLQQVAACQLSVGCSNFCRRCNEWALAGVRKHFSFEAARHIVRDLHAAGNDSYALYSASDPLDYRCGDRTIADLLSFMHAQGYRTQFGLLTKVPRGSERLAKQFLEAGADIAVSLTEKNKPRVAEIEARAGKRFNAHHDTADLLIPAGLDEDFATVKSSITDNYGIEITPEGAGMVVPTYTSALNPTGQCRIPITAASQWFLKKKVGREALPVEYFKPLAAVSADGKAIVLEGLLTPQVENILLDSGNRGPTPPGMMDLAEYFKTFDPTVVRQRRKLSSPAVENLRRQIFEGEGGATVDRQALEQQFERKRQAYLDFCDLEKVAGFKRQAVRYLLAAAADYLSNRPSEREIIRHLRREEAADLNRRSRGGGRPGAAAIEDLLTDSAADPFDTFSRLLFRLLEDPADGEVAAFLSAGRARYDQETDRFVQS